MPEEKLSNILEEIKSIHIGIEKILQYISSQSSSATCSMCVNVCCKEDICRESIDSDFLRFILGRKATDYHKDNGWFDKKTGCQITFGRPLVCYEYFCSQLKSDVRVFKLQQLSKEFVNVYSRVFRERHILEVDNINLIPMHKLTKTLQKLKDFKVKANKAMIEEIKLRRISRPALNS
ncbi:MAG: hypothetical protein ACI8PD_000690 [Nitrospinales bacterium]|jgi:hypothetical protein